MDNNLPETKILVLIPAFNESSRIANVVTAARRYLPVLVVDDGSSDSTAECARQAGAEVLLQRPNRGKGAALRCGFQHALDGGYEAVLTLDADGQHDPQEIPAFLEVARLHPVDLIIGERDFSCMPPVRRLANSLGRACLSLALGQPVRDNQSGYRLISRPVMQAMLESGIATRRAVMCSHREPAYRREPWSCGLPPAECGCPPGPCARLVESERAQDHAIVLPLFHQMTLKDVHRVVVALGRACHESHPR